jgi:ketosteroid isomerase-like protein
MSQESVEIAREAVERLNRGDVDALLDDLYDPEAVWHSREDEPDTGVYHGREAIREMARVWRDTFEELHFDVVEYIEAGEVVVVVGAVSVRSRGANAEVREPYTWLTKLRDGRIIEVREYRTKTEALETLGLSE